MVQHRKPQKNICRDLDSIHITNQFYVASLLPVIGMLLSHGGTASCMMNMHSPRDLGPHIPMV